MNKVSPMTVAFYLEIIFWTLEEEEEKQAEMSSVSELRKWTELKAVVAVHTCSVELQRGRIYAGRNCRTLQKSFPEFSEFIVTYDAQEGDEKAG